ncbi:MAG: hypothetical protein ACRETW_02205 [Stenotrophobium sp.]
MGFKSVGDLLRWAFEYSARSEGAASSLRAAVGSTGESPLAGLSHFELKGQAAQVMMWVGSLPLAEKMVVFGQYSDAAQRSTVAFTLIGIVPAHYGIPAAKFAIERWFDASGSLTKQRLAEKMNRSVRSADDYFSLVARKLELIRGKALGRAARRFADLIDVAPTCRSSTQCAAGRVCSTTVAEQRVAMAA